MDSPLVFTLMIAIGAVPGALSRYFVTEWTKSAFGTKFPYGTFVINLTGCLLMGFFFTLSKGITGYPKELDLLIRTGFLGSYTTFSTYGYDALSLWRNKNTGATLFYWAGSAVFGVIAVYLGVSIAHVFVR
ncbi:fluoride efflux transporter CrcB [Gloeothece verrucosa]|uniref:Fluoride-specific ion channel FluC n=1 Tax=Gloeothece verrucosa (strain PCC 7822) TaxID=497965 RepID=E0UEB9_GLOV7|nr:fluoride efflux transporter CrcB [Gloeothece verrucosa]ADN15365.1 CrcB protein [Gloeothece verrucosa PCC 7822]